MAAERSYSKKTLETLDQLEGLRFGEQRFDDEAFWRLHHFREKRNAQGKPIRATIQSHRAYCNKHSSFRENNTLVQVRLDQVLTDYLRAPADFVFLAEKAYKEHPPSK
jgi:hypothetical protein